MHQLQMIPAVARDVRFEISEGSRASLARWMREPLMVGPEYLWLGGQRLWHALDATHQGYPDLQDDRQPSLCSAPGRPHQDGQHSPIPRR